MIEARGLCMHYGQVAALVDASFRAERGEVVGLLGPNGAGKTTTMRILTTFQQPSAGSATVAGFDVVASPLEVRRRIGYLPETLPLYMSMEVRECLAFVGRARGLAGTKLTERVHWVVERCGLERMFHTPCLELSKGFRQRTALAQALVHDPEVVILDEPTSGLDPHQILEIRALIRDLATTRTVILSTHVLQEASALSDRLVILNRGRIVGAGTPDDLRRQAGITPRVQLAVTGESDDLAVALAGVPSAGAVRELDPGVFEIEEQDPGLADAVGTLCRDRGLVVTALERDRGRIEDVFLKLTRPAGEVAAPESAESGASGEQAA